VRIIFSNLFIRRIELLCFFLHFEVEKDIGKRALIEFSIKFSIFYVKKIRAIVESRIFSILKTIFILKTSPKIRSYNIIPALCCLCGKFFQPFAFNWKIFGYFLNYCVLFSRQFWYGVKLIFSIFCQQMMYFNKLNLRRSIIW
jgi:hypothetical protein